MRVRYTTRALGDLKDIFEYICERRPKGATNVKSNIKMTIEALGRSPRRGHEVEQRPELRRIPVTRYPYVIFFRVRNDTVEIVHIRHGARAEPKAEDL